MESPNARLRRRNSQPCRLQRRPSVLRTQLRTMMSNPHVGSFRHSPHTDVRSIGLAPAFAFPLSVGDGGRGVGNDSQVDRRGHLAHHHLLALGSLDFRLATPSLKGSPYVGWFCHESPTEGQAQTRKADRQSLSEECRQLACLLDTAPVASQRCHSGKSENASRFPFTLSDGAIHGHLRGGGGGHQQGNCNCNSEHSPIEERRSQGERQNRIVDAIHRALDGSSSAETPSAAVKILARLGSWVLFPIVYDAESCGYTHFSDHRGGDDDCDAKSRESPTNTVDAFDLFPKISSTVRGPGCDGGGDDDDSCSSSLTSDSESHSEVGGDAHIDIDIDIDIDGGDSNGRIDGASILLGTLSSNDPSCSANNRRSRTGVFVSGITGAAYGANLTVVADATREEHQERSLLRRRGNLANLLDDDEHRRLDYDITQMDIARMARNASRRLDVDSILNLPTVLYRARKKDGTVPCRVQGDTTGDRDSGDSSREAWSWMMIEGPKPDDGPSAKPAVDRENDDNDDACVICLGRFRNGDRMRILPCDHSFHVGCIDRWLSGSHPCRGRFAGGCPTCKRQRRRRRPNLGSGSVPSWAFEQLGNALAQSATAR